MMMQTELIIDLVVVLLLLVGSNGFVPTISRSRRSYSSSTMYMSIQQNNIAKYIGYIAIAGGMTFGSPSYGDSLKSGLSEYEKVVESQSSLSLSSTEILEPEISEPEIELEVEPEPEPEIIEDNFLDDLNNKNFVEEVKPTKQEINESKALMNELLKPKKTFG
jgi:hypothetical protein